MSASNHKVGSPINVWQSLANKFINQSSQLKVYWDKVGEIVREKHDALCDYIDSYIATKQELQQVTIGLIPDGTVTQDKLAPSLKDSLPAQYVRNRIPTSGDNFASGHKIGDAWYIPDITLNNLVPTPLAINTTDFTIQNANASASGSAVTLSCLGGFDFALFKRTITPVAGALYVLFADLKLTSTHVLTSLSLNDQVIASPVKDTVYHVACVVTAPTEIEIKAQALDGTALNGATVVIDKLTIVNMTADMDDVPFDKAGAEAYFQVNPVFLTHKFNNAKTRWYCSDNGVWQSSSQLSDETQALYGVENVDDALKCVVPHITSSYIGFAGNVNARQLGSSFVPAFKDELKAKNVQLGSQIMEYLMDFQAVSLTASEMEEFRKCNDWYDCCNNLTVRSKMIGNSNFLAMINTVPFAQYGLMYGGSEKFLVDKANALAGTSFLTLAEVIKSTTAMNLAMKDKEFCEVLRGNTELEKIAFGNTGERLTFLQGSGNFTVPVGVTNLNYVMVSGGGYYPTIGKILAGALAVTPGASLAYNVGNGSLTATLNETTFGGLTTASGATITDANCSILLRALSGGGSFPTLLGGVGAGAIGGGNANTTNRVGNGIGLISDFVDSLMNLRSYRKANRISDSILVNRLIALGVFGGGGGATGSNGGGGGGGGGYGASSGQKGSNSTGAGGIGGCGYGEGGGGTNNAAGKASACGSPADTGAKGVLVLFWGQ